MNYFILLSLDPRKVNIYFNYIKSIQFLLYAKIIKNYLKLLTSKNN